MHGLANILSDNPSLQHMNELQEFLQVLSSIHIGLNQSIQGTNTVVNKSPPHLAPQSPHRAKRMRYTVLPPSPENRQTRKNSHAPL